MAYYIKANHLVAEFLKLDNVRLKLRDGNYMLWQADMLAFGPLTELKAACVSIGAIMLMPHEARQEQDGTTCRTLPPATDARFFIEPEPEQPEPEQPEPEQPDPEQPEPEQDSLSDSAEPVGEDQGEVVAEDQPHNS